MITICLGLLYNLIGIDGPPSRPLVDKGGLYITTSGLPMNGGITTFTCWSLMYCVGSVSPPIINKELSERKLPMIIIGSGSVAVLMVVSGMITSVTSGFGATNDATALTPCTSPAPDNGLWVDPYI